MSRPLTYTDTAISPHPSRGRLIARQFLETPSFRFPLPAGGTKSRLPTPPGGDRKEGGKTPLTHRSPEKLSGYQWGRGGWGRWRRGLLLALIGFTPLLLVAQESLPVPRVMVGVDTARNPQEVSTSLQILAMLTLLSVAPSILLMMTAFTRIVIVLSFLKSALGTPNIPPTPVLIGLSLFLTFYVMAPTLEQMNRDALQPYMKKQITFEQALHRAQKPLRHFMLRQTYTEELNLFLHLRKQPAPRTPDDVPLTVLIPAFILSELKTAFLIGFYIYIPFLVIDLVVASILLSMGMMMLPPVVVSMPAKLLVFTLANGWSVLTQALIQGFR
jgi:flagellar biosynthetic protein FliP